MEFQVMYVEGQEYEWQFVSPDTLPQIGFVGRRGCMSSDVLRHMLFRYPELTGKTISKPIVYRKREKLYVVDEDCAFYKLEDYIVLRRLHGIS